VRALDTNVLVRYLTADEPVQARAAERFIEVCRKNEEPLFISILVLCETAWVLARTYRQPKAEVIRTLEQIIETNLFIIERDDLVRRSIEQFRLGKANFADYLIGNIARNAGCTDTVTFDRALAASPEFTVLHRSSA